MLVTATLRAEISFSHPHCRTRCAQSNSVCSFLCGAAAALRRLGLAHCAQQSAASHSTLAGLQSCQLDSQAGGEFFLRIGSGSTTAVLLVAMRFGWRLLGGTNGHAQAARLPLVLRPGCSCVLFRLLTLLTRL